MRCITIITTMDALAAMISTGFIPFLPCVFVGMLSTWALGEVEDLEPAP